MRYFIAFFTALGLLFLLLFLLFHGGSKPKTAVPLTTKALVSYAQTDSEVRMTIDGPVNANQAHRAIRVIVNRNDVIFEQIQGYDGNVTNVQTYANTQSAYEVFLASLAKVGFTMGDGNPAHGDERGFCAQGERYIFQLRQDGKDVSRYWTSTCGSPKTYLGVPTLTLSLFQAQVPKYYELINGLGL